ncbi:single-stranded-DNA-specific exonuclease RecJ [Enterococcus sp. JM4C]|uniref:single-stranded-DNA-specific exonuclease RecJ n=1 Tax=Candidatus Enterococcus huntleyi TaxID=1857217 RepID=UPI001379F218|nr:single-stranded-DNA-specific exonuclease RecJ [Enterococcus sp. JM4C]KAF1296956.1 single-stranded-DNA-specific exonuclease RecJ [Enterococcus sp. JM4C]
MKQSNYHWQLPEEQQINEDFLQEIEKRGFSPLIGQLLWQRSIQTPEEMTSFLAPSLDQLHDPYLMHDMERAVSRIQQAVIGNEQILVYGDYDADGITSTTIMKETLELLGAEVDYFLPNRFIQGYGPNKAVYQEKIEAGVQLIITVDNGVAGHEALAYAKSQGVDVIVTDHHELPAELPEAYAIVHPRHPEGNYPFGDLAGVGVAYKVATALLEEAPAEFLDLVAIGTIADLVSLTGENRTLVTFGLAAMKQTERLGLAALFKESGVNPEEVTETSIGFSIGPRLNAIGRLDDPNPAVELFSTFDEEVAANLAALLNQKNDERKAIVEKITAEALAMVQPANQVHLIAHEGWHEGVLGIVAGRIMNETGKPTIVLTIKEDGSAKGSGRSVEALNLYEMLSSMNDLFTHFGGHHAAVGLTMPAENIASLQEQMNDYIVAQAIDLTKGVPLKIDEVLSVEEVSVAFIQQLRVLAPFGTDNPLPTFLFQAGSVNQIKRIGSEQQHLKFSLTKDAASLDAIAFGFGGQAQELENEGVKVVGELSINEWNGRKKPQLMVKDFAIEGLQLFDWRAKRFWQHPLISDASLYVVFAEKNKKILQQQVAEQAVTFESIEQIQQVIMDKQPKELIFVDCPETQDILKEITQLWDFSRIYLLFATPDEAYLNGVGSREQYARLFKFIHQHKQVDVRYKINSVAQFLKIPQNLLIFMIQVFFELGFVTIENGVLNKVEQPENHPLTESTLYQGRLKQIKSEEYLLLSDIPTIKNWLQS